MRAINHALTGAIIGLTVSEPVVAVIAALVSHYVLDMMPHYSSKTDNKPKLLRSTLFKRLLYADAIGCIGLVLLLGVDRPLHWVLAAFCAFVAAAPDFLSINRYRTALKNKRWKAGWYTAWASRIQWFERPIGAVVEVAWFAAGVIVLLPFLR